MAETPQEMSEPPFTLDDMFDYLREQGTELIELSHTLRALVMLTQERGKPLDLLESETIQKCMINGDYFTVLDEMTSQLLRVVAEIVARNLDLSYEEILQRSHALRGQLHRIRSE